MARAKRTARADARRRYRAEHAAIEDDHRAGEATDDRGCRGADRGQAPRRRPRGQAGLGIGHARSGSRSARSTSAPTSPPCPGSRSTRRRCGCRCCSSSAARSLIAFTGGDESSAQFMFAYFIQTPAIGGVFLAGFLAPRASWLLGVLVGLASALCYAVVILFFPTTVAATTPTTSQATDAIVAALVLSPTMGAFFAAAAAWYRRFLQLSNPNRGQQQSKAKARRPNARAAEGRRPPRVRRRRPAPDR